MVNRESSKHFENNPFCASTLLLFSLFNKDVYFILKLVQFTTMRLAVREVLVNNLPMRFTIMGFIKIIVHQNIQIGEDMNMEMRCKTH